MTRFTAEKIEKLKHLLKKEGIESLQIQTISQKGKYTDIPLSFAQQRLWFLAQLESESFVYNIPVAYRLTGLLNIASLEQSFNETIRRHSILRTTFPSVDGQPSQVLTLHKALTLAIIDFQDHRETERETIAQQIATEEAQHPFDLAAGPLFRVKLLCLSNQEHILRLKKNSSGSGEHGI